MAGLRAHWGWEERLHEHLSKQLKGAGGTSCGHQDKDDPGEGNSKALRQEYACDVWETTQGLGAWTRVNERRVVGNEARKKGGQIAERVRKPLEETWLLISATWELLESSERRKDTT